MINKERGGNLDNKIMPQISGTTKPKIFSQKKQSLK